MPYFPSVPQATDIIAQSQLDFLNNFERVEQVWPQDHTGLDEAAEDRIGKHIKLSLPEQAADPTVAANNTALYCKEDSSASELFVREESDGTVSALTSGGKLIQPGLTLGAFAIFDRKGNILKSQLRQPDGTTITTPLSYNVSNVTANEISGRYFSQFLVTYTNALATANYFWVLSAVGQGQKGAVLYGAPKKNATYGDSVKVGSMIVVAGEPQASGREGLTQDNLQRFQFQVFTVTP